MYLRHGTQLSSLRNIDSFFDLNSSTMQWREHGIWGQEAWIVVGIHPETFVLKVFVTLFTLDLSCPHL